MSSPGLADYSILNISPAAKIAGYLHICRLSLYNYIFTISLSATFTSVYMSQFVLAISKYRADFSEKLISLVRVVNKTLFVFLNFEILHLPDCILTRLLHA